MAEVQVKVTEDFRDRTADLQLRKKDEVLTVSEERAKLLVGRGLAKVVEPKNPEEPQEAPKKRTSKKETESK